MCEFVKEFLTSNFVTQSISCIDIFLSSLASILFAWSMFGKEESVKKEYDREKFSGVTVELYTFKPVADGTYDVYFGYDKIGNISKQDFEDIDQYNKSDKGLDNKIINYRKLRDVAYIAALFIWISSYIAINGKIKDPNTSLCIIVCFIAIQLFFVKVLSFVLDKKHQYILKPVEALKRAGIYPEKF